MLNPNYYLDWICSTELLIKRFRDALRQLLFDNYSKWYLTKIGGA